MHPVFLVVIKPANTLVIAKTTYFQDSMSVAFYKAQHDCEVHARDQIITLPMAAKGNLIYLY